MRPKILFLVFLCYSIIGNTQCQNFSLSVQGQDPICHNYSDGAINVSTLGENGDVTVTITDSTGTIFNPPPGGTQNILPGGMWYYIEVLDDSSCYLIDSVYLINPPPLLIQTSFTDPSSLNACDGVAVVDTVLNYQGSYSNITYIWNPGGPNGIGENVKSDFCNDFYDLVVIDEYGCDYVEEIASGSATLKVNEFDFQAYPNPTTGIIHLKSENLDLNKVEVYDVYGKLIFSSSSSGSIDLSSLESGQYILKLVSEGRVLTVKVIKD